MKKTIAIGLLFLSCAVFAVPNVENVIMTQDVSTGLVTVNYDLKDEAAIITLDILVGGTSIGADKVVKVEGDVNKLVSVGTGKRVSWRPDGEWDGTAASATAEITAWPLEDPPDYLVANLAIQGDVHYYTCSERVPGGVTHITYQVEKLLMRRIHAKGITWKIGSTTGIRDAQREAYFDVTLTNDFYIAVYPFTQGQYYSVWGKRPDDTNKYGGETGNWDWPCYPMSYCSYPKLRGLPADGFNWPDNGHSVSNLSMIGVLRTRTGLANLDLPVEAQWEFAARAGDYVHDLYNGYNLTNGDTGDAYIDEIAWHPGNSATNGFAKSSHPVGGKTPNAYGLYDMLGNVWEICVDRFQWKSDYPEPNYNPNVGSISQYTSLRNMRGGAATSDYGAKTCRVCYREVTSESDTATRWDKGFRPAMTLYP